MMFIDYLVDSGEEKILYGNRLIISCNQFMGAIFYDTRVEPIKLFGYSSNMGKERDRRLYKSNRRVVKL